MGKKFAFLALCLVCCLTMVGCAAKKDKTDPTVAEYQKFRQGYDGLADDLILLEAESDQPAKDVASLPLREPKSRAGSRDRSSYLPPTDSRATSVVLQRAHRAIGTPYVFGGTKPGGFDCSGLVQWAYKGAGIQLPRTAREQSQAGFRIKRSQMRAGDIVAFRRSSGSGYHTGIYLGDDKFIHAPSTNKRVRIESLHTNYFARNFIGARRVDMSDRDIELARATVKKDQQYVKAAAEKKAKRSVAKAKSSKNKTVAKASKSKVSKSKVAKASKKSAVKRTAAKSSKVKKATVSRKSVEKAAAKRSKASQTAAKSSRNTSKKTVASNTRKSSKSIEVRPARRSVDEIRASRNKG